MKPEEIRIAIAEACGWRDIRGLNWTGVAPNRDLNYRNGVPDYLNDLNACHEMENVLLRDMNKLWYPYCKRLHELTNGIGEGATAPQRCDAFLKTLGLWK